MSDATTKICANCGGNIVYDIKAGTLKCESCGAVYETSSDHAPIHEYAFNDVELKKTDIDWNNMRSTYRCTGCGNEIMVDSADVTASCAYCGSTYVLTDKAEKGVRPEAIVLFQVDKRDVMGRLSRWIKRRYFAPRALKLLYQHASLTPEYVPYWTYDAEADAHYTGEGGKTRTVTQKNDKGEEITRTETRWYHESGYVNASFDDVLVRANRDTQFNSLIERAETVSTQNAVPFDPAYTSGYATEKYTLSARDGFDTAKEKMEDTLKSLAHGDIRSKGYDDSRVHSLNARYRDVTFKHILLPFWLSTYTFAGKVYNIVINGQTGEIKGEAPVSKVKVALTVVATIAAIAGAYLIYKYYLE